MLIPLSYRSHVQLFDYFQPQDDHFYPLPCLRPQPHSLARPVETGGITPLPDPQEVLSSTPAWDPSSRTPGWTPRWLSSPQASESRSSPLPAVPPALTSTLLDPHAPTKRAAPMEHVLFDPQLLDIKLKVKFMGGAHENKETDIVSSIVDG